MMKEIKINGINDFNLVHIFECGQCFRWNKEETDIAEVGNSEVGCAYIGIAGGYVARANFIADVDSCRDTCKGDISSTGTLILEVSGGDEEFWGHYLDLETDYGEIKSTLIKMEATTPSLFNTDIRILNQEVFETLISFIVSQNNNIPRIKKCIEAMCERYGEPLGKFWGKERFAFPTPEALAKAEPWELAELGLGYRNEYIPRAARQFLEEGAPSSYEQLLSYHGIGPKVANCILLFGLHKLDAFPIDTWVKHIMNDRYGFDESDTRGMANFARERFGKYAGYMQQLLFYHYRERK